MVFVVRNVGIATAIAVTVLGRGEFVVCAIASLLAQMPILLAAVVVSDAGRSLTEATPQELTTHESSH
jgi:ACR3 family arsenite efflux pump ArsB